MIVVRKGFKAHNNQYIRYQLNSFLNYIIGLQKHNRMMHKDSEVMMVRDIQKPNHHEDISKARFIHNYIVIFIN